MIDTLMIEALAANVTPKEIDEAFQEYAEIGGFLDNGIKQQTEFNVEAFVTATGRNLTKSESGDDRSGVEGDALDVSRHRNDASEFSRHRRTAQAGGKKTDRGNGPGVLLRFKLSIKGKEITTIKRR
jgi:hypothetical protein